MTKKMILFILSLVASEALSAQSASFIINGTVSGMQNGEIYLQYISNGTQLRDTAKITDQQFRFEKKLSEPVIGTLYLARTPLAVQLFLEPGQTNVNISSDRPYKVTVEGGRIQQEYQLFMNQVKDVQYPMNQTYDIYWNIDAGLKRDSLYDKYLSLQQELKKRVEIYIKNNPASIVGAWAVSENYYNASSDEISVLFNQFTAQVKESHYGRSVKALLNKVSRNAYNKRVPTIVGQDTSAVWVTIQNMKADYILVDFWASWCLPCRKENPHLMAVYKKYQDKSFEIVGFSLDDNLERWKKAIRDDGITWLNISDLKGWGKSAVCDSVGVNNVPMNLLLDKDKKIIARNLRGNDLDRFLVKLFQY